jgi:DinB superfamily
MSTTEWWQRGPVDGVPAMLQPVAHIVLQIGESVSELVAGLNDAQWNARPAGVASIAFHVRHIIGVMDRLFTYARNESLNDAQFVALRGEGAPIVAADIPALLAQLDGAVAAAVAELKITDPATLGDFRGVGRAQLPSTVIGCLVHGAEHSMRHVGQLSVTARIVRAGNHG